MKKGKKHTGKTKQPGAAMNRGSHTGGRDPHADKAYHSANKAHGMDEGVTAGDYDGEGPGEGLTGGNCSDEGY